MGYHVSHSIIVSCWDRNLLRKTWKEAKYIFTGTAHYVSNLTPPANNSMQSYFIAPDGSKKDWPCSIQGWNARKKFISYLKELKPYQPDWVLVQFADDNRDTKVIDSSDHFNPNVFGQDSITPRPEDHYD